MAKDRVGWAATEERANELAPIVRADSEAIASEMSPSIEDSPSQRASVHYERDPRLRALAVAIHGTTCMTCGFSSEEQCGEWGRDYIEVHHITPIADRPESGDTDPESDMVVLCSNCHRMVHRRRGIVVTFDELKEKRRVRKGR
jgi:predicted HNH restriction endonuclease